MSARPIYRIDTARSGWTSGRVHGLSDAIADARVLDRPLHDWDREHGVKDAPARVEGPCVLVGRDLWVSPLLLRDFAHLPETALCRLGRRADGPASLSDPLSRLVRDDEGNLRFDLWLVPAGVSLDVTDLAALEGAKLTDVPGRTRRRPVPADPEVVGTEELELVFSSHTLCPVAHWAELLRANLLALGARPFEQGGGLGRFLWAAARAGSFEPNRVFAKLNRVGEGCDIHPSAVVEGCRLGDFVEVGPGAILRGCSLGNGAKVGAQAICELSVIGEGARIQRRAMVTVSTVYPRARMGGVLQFALAGEASVTKMFAVATDMRLEGPVRAMTPDGLRDVDVGYLGVCFGHRSFIGSGVWIAPGRVVPEGARIGRTRAEMVMDPGTPRE